MGSQSSSLGDTIYDNFYTKYEFDETWADMAGGFLYRRQIENIKKQYLIKIKNNIKKIDTNTLSPKEQILKKEFFALYIEYRKKFHLYNISQRDKTSYFRTKFTALMVEFKLVNTDCENLDKKQLLALRPEILQKLYEWLKNNSNVLFAKVNEFYEDKKLDKNYKDDIETFKIAKDIINYYEYDLVDLNDDKYKEVAKFKDNKEVTYKYKVYSYTVYRWFNDKNKEIIKAFFNNFFGFNDESELKTHLNKINFKEEKFNEEKAKESIRGGEEGNRLGYFTKVFTDLIVLRMVLEVMKMEYCMHIPASRHLTPPKIKIYDNIEGVMPNKFLEEEFNNIANSTAKINLFYKNNIFITMIENLDGTIRKFLDTENLKSEELIQDKDTKAFKSLFKWFIPVYNKNLDKNNIENDRFTKLRNLYEKITNNPEKE